MNKLEILWYQQHVCAECWHYLFTRQDVAVCGNSGQIKTFITDVEECRGWKSYEQFRKAPKDSGSLQVL
jgi:hypothetical protein